MEQGSDRLHALDAVRGFALLCGIGLHATLPWLENLPDWNFDQAPSAIAAAIWYFVHIFRMPVFFLIAGYFGRLLTERRGTLAFIRDRAKRITLPLCIGALLIPVFTLLAYALGSLAGGMSVADLTALATAQREKETHAAAGAARGGMSLGHLWFLYYLLMFYVGALIVRAAARAAFHGGKPLCHIDRTLRFLMRTGLAAPALGLPVAAWYVFNWPEWPCWTGLPAPVSIVPSVPALLAYGLIFAIGWLLHRQRDLVLQLRERWMHYSIAAIALAAACYSIAGPTPVWSPYLHGWELRVYAGAYLTAAWCASFALIGLSLRFLAHPSPVRRYVADSSYWLYLMHMSAIVFFVQCLHPLDWHWSVKYTITVAASVPLLLLSYQAFVRFTFIGAILNGRRAPRSDARGRLGDRISAVLRMGGGRGIRA
ncbi:acyltransferase family protein [Mycobacterium neumannii]|uniref:acyltransferase family protein n=1 Tax=Mycobacterium neumannii TaxID=2048551 RepID=UPI003AB497A0